MSSKPKYFAMAHTPWGARRVRQGIEIIAADGMYLFTVPRKVSYLAWMLAAAPELYNVATGLADRITQSFAEPETWRMGQAVLLYGLEDAIRVLYALRRANGELVTMTEMIRNMELEHERIRGDGT